MESVPRDNRLPLSDTDLRGIVFSPVPASAYAGAIRASLASLFKRGLLGAPQLGAAPGGGTEFVFFTSRPVLHWRRRARWLPAFCLLMSAIACFAIGPLIHAESRRQVYLALSFTEEQIAAREFILA